MIRKLTDAQRKTIQTISFGEFIPNDKIELRMKETVGLDYLPIYSVGDMVTEKFIELRIPIRLAVIDGSTQRKDIDKKRLFAMAVYFPAHKTVVNTAGCISELAEKTVKIAIQSQESTLVRILGEEDLMFITIAMYADLGSIIFYGQPPIDDGGHRQGGIVKCLLNKALRRKVLEVYDSMEKIYEGIL